MCYPWKRIIVGLLRNTGSEVSIAGSSKQVTYARAEAFVCIQQELCDAQCLKKKNTNRWVREPIVCPGPAGATFLGQPFCILESCQGGASSPGTSLPVPLIQLMDTSLSMGEEK